MSVQFGKWNCDGQPVDAEYLAKVQALLVPYGPDRQSSHVTGNLAMLYHAFHTTKESRNEIQPHVCASGAVLTWDGRLDNREDVIRTLPGSLTANATDIALVAAAYEGWGTGCFARLLGDWALAIWNPSEQSVLLAKDFVGTRHLYYSTENNQITWSTLLDPLVLLAGRTFELEEEYIAGWLAFFPATHLTPYVGIHAVPPSCFVLLRPGKTSVTKYWDFDPCKRIRYRSDAEYEEHFRAVFRESVRRRLRSDRPILAELSGGMDSSSIVCMADTIIAAGEAETPNLDTVSYYNDSEPNWNERPYFTKVEQLRGQVGYHIRANGEALPFAEIHPSSFAATPAHLGCNEVIRECAAHCDANGYGVVLSGIGGDEVTGGVPTAVPEIQDSLAKAHLAKVVEQLNKWALSKRKPWLYLLGKAMIEFVPLKARNQKAAISWLTPDFARRHRSALLGYPSRLRLFGPLPSFQHNLAALKGLKRQLAHSVFAANFVSERSYPYLDRSFLEFSFSLPREQLIRPYQRRSLMRRSLSGIVPDEIIDRKRKGYAARAPILALSSEWSRLLRDSQVMTIRSLGIVEQSALFPRLLRNSSLQIPNAAALMRVALVESWLRNSVRGLMVGNRKSMRVEKALCEPASTSSAS